MPKISLMIHTASFDDFLSNQGISSYFKAVIHCLKHQHFKDFEFIFIDTFYEENKDNFKLIYENLPFQVKHVPIHFNHRYWYDKGYCYISAAKNTGIIYADGELIVTCDDAEFFPEQFLSKYWNHYINHNYMFALHHHLDSIVLENDIVKMPIGGNEIIKDHRFDFLVEDVTSHQYGTWAYAGSSFSLRDALILNGFNEKMDGCKSLEDCDFGNRLVFLGRKFVSDKDGYLFILNHRSYGDVFGMQWDTPEVKKEFYGKKQISNFIAVENYGILRCAEELFELKANRTRITNNHLKIIQRETIKYRGFDPLAPENKEKLDLWLGTPNFSLEQERTHLRNSGEWKWNK